MGQRLYELRSRKGLTQEGLARLADVSLAAVRNWEKGKRTPSFEMATKLADALRITLDELAGRTPPPAEEPPAPPKPRKKGGK